jgi:hypothetical protein
MNTNPYRAPSTEFQEPTARRTRLPAIATVALGFVGWLLLPYMGGLFPLEAPVTPTLSLCAAVIGAVAAALAAFLCRGGALVHVGLIVIGAGLRILGPGLIGGSPSLEYGLRVLARLPFLSLLAAAALVAFVLRIVQRRNAAQRPNNSSKPTPLRGAA